eukprot:scpid81799/ scgid18458/ 
MTCSALAAASLLAVLLCLTSGVDAQIPSCAAGHVPITAASGTTTCTALGSLLIALANVHDGSSYDLMITTIAGTSAPTVVNLQTQMLSSAYAPPAISADLDTTTQVIVAVFAMTATTPLDVYIKDTTQVTQNNLLAMMKDSRNYMMQGTVAGTSASPTRPLTVRTGWRPAGDSSTPPVPTALYRTYRSSCYDSSPTSCAIYTAISINAASPTTLPYDDYEVVFQVTASTGGTKYITPPLRLTVNTDIILGQTPVCPLAAAACTCSDGFSWNSTRCATAGSHLIAAGVPTGTNGTIVLHNILGTADRPKVTFLNNQTIDAHLTPSQVTSSTNFVANMMVGMTSYAAVLYSMSPALAREANFTAVLSGFTDQESVLVQKHNITHDNTSIFDFAPNVPTNAEYRTYNSTCYEATAPVNGCEWIAFTSPLNLEW